MKEEREIVADDRFRPFHHPFGLKFTTLSKDEIVGALLGAPLRPGQEPRLIITANVDHVVRLRHDAAFRAAYRSAWMITPDGMPVYLYARLWCPDLRGRIAGSDLIGPLIDGFDPGLHRPFFVCAREALARELQARLVRRGFNPAAAGFAAPSFGFEDDRDASLDLAHRIRAHGTTHLVMGLGAPKSEVWVDRHRRFIGSCYVLPVGAGLEFLVGAKRRAPLALQAVGLEWAWRLGQEPRRLCRRYLVESWPFLAAIRDDLRGRSLLERDPPLVLARSRP